MVELDDGGVVGFEIKTGNRVPGEQIKALKNYAMQSEPTFLEDTFFSRPADPRRPCG